MMHSCPHTINFSFNTNPSIASIAMVGVKRAGKKRLEITDLFHG
jgi:hypothetical protein